MRKSIRIQGFDYGGVGTYFITMVTHKRRRLFGSIANGVLRPTDMGDVAVRCWHDIPAHQPHATLDVFVAMPDHVHGIIRILTSPQSRAFETFTSRRIVARVDKNGRIMPLQPTQTIGSIVRGFKIGVTMWARAPTSIDQVWQDNYYERILRDDRALHAVRRYIALNPARWRG